MKKNQKNEKNKKIKPSTKNDKSSNYKFKYVSISLIVAFLTCLFLFFAKEQIVSSFINNTLYGLFGKTSALIPFFSIGLSVYVVKSQSDEHISSKYILSAVFLLFIAVFAHLCKANVCDPIAAFKDAYSTFTNAHGGGFFGALIAFPFFNAIGRGATIAIVVIIELILISLIINKSLFTVLFGAARGTVSAIKKEGENIDHERDYEEIKKRTHKKIRKIQNHGYDVVVDKRTRNERAEDIIGVAKEYAGKGTSKCIAKPTDSIFSKGLVESIEENDGIDEVFGRLKDEHDKFNKFVDRANEPNKTSPIDVSKEFTTKRMPHVKGEMDQYNGEGVPNNKPQATNDEQTSLVKGRTEELYEDFSSDPAKKRESNLTKEEAGLISAELDASAQEEPIREYVHPTLNLLKKPLASSGDQREAMRKTSQQLIQILNEFGVKAKLLQVTQGPTVTRYEIQPNTGIKLAKIQNLAEDLALHLGVPTVLVSPVPGKAAVGIEIPNKEVNSVSGRELFASDEFQNAKSKLTFALGKDIGGRVIVGDIGKMPHLLIAGATGSGKSVCVNTIIASILYNASPDEVKLIMIDPKVVELGVYNGIPHLLIPVVTDPKRAAGALNWAVSEMMHRYDLFRTNSVRNIEGYNELMEKNCMRKMHKIVIIIDELADLMMVAAKEVEDYICRLTQLARAAGIHLIVATQRPSVDVVTGLIKANIPSRIAFAVSSQVDSRTIIDRAGAEKLLGKGDMLYYPQSARTPIRVQGAFISDEEIENVIDFIKENNPIETHYSEDLQEHIERVSTGENGVTDDKPELDEPLLPKAITMAAEAGQISTSMIQRKLSVGYSRAGRIIDQMEERGIVGPANGSKPRQVYISPQEAREMFNQGIVQTDIEEEC